MLKLCFAVVVGLMVFTAQAAADTIKLKNGDRLTGAIVQSDEKALVLKTDYAGEITVSWEAIQEIESKEPLHVFSKNGKKMVGTLASSDNKIAVTTQDVGRVELDKSEITTLRNNQQQAKEDRYLNPSWRDLWTASANYGLVFTAGNASITNTTIGVEVERDTPRDKTAMFYRQITTTDRNVSPSLKIANAKRGGVEYLYHLTPRIKLFGFANFDSDEFLQLDLRMVPGGGVGYKVLKNERALFRVYGGFAYNREVFDLTPRPTSAVPTPARTILTRTGVEGLLGEEWRYKINARTSFFEKVEYYPSLTGSGARLNTDAGITTALNKYLSWNVYLSTRYLEQPPLPGLKKNDTLLTTGIGFNFGK